jgi:hypothetical protein
VGNTSAVLPIREISDDEDLEKVCNEFAQSLGDIVRPIAEAVCATKLDQLVEYLNDNPQLECADIAKLFGGGGLIGDVEGDLVLEICQKIKPIVTQ